MMSELSTPSSIEINEETIKRNYESHESFGFRKRPLAGPSISELPSTATIEERVSAHPSKSLPEKEPESSMNRILNSEDLYSFSHAPEGDQSQDIFVQTTNADANSSDRRDRQASAVFNKLVRQAIPPTRRRIYTSEPPAIPHSEYIGYTGNLDNDLQRSTQVLIWTIARRINRLDKKAALMSMSTVEFFNTKRMLLTIQEKLEWQSIGSKWNMHDSLSLKPRMTNPMNEDNRKILEKSEKYRSSLENENSITQRLQMKADECYSKDVANSDRKSKAILSTPVQKNNENESDDATFDKLYTDPLKEAVTMTDNLLEMFIEETIEKDGRSSQITEHLCSILEQRKITNFNHAH